MWTFWQLWASSKQDALQNFCGETLHCRWRSRLRIHTLNIWKIALEIVGHISQLATGEAYSEQIYLY